MVSALKFSATAAVARKLSAKASLFSEKSRSTPKFESAAIKVRPSQRQRRKPRRARRLCKLPMPCARNWPNAKPSFELPANTAVLHDCDIAITNFMSSNADNSNGNDLVKNSSLYREFQAEREEILRHKWIESEKEG